jgi:hypothetical protein
LTRLFLFSISSVIHLLYSTPDTPSHLPSLSPHSPQAPAALLHPIT